MNIVGDLFSDEDFLLDSCMFYADDNNDFFLPDFSLSSCMSNTTSSSSSSSSSSTLTTTVIKSCDTQDYAPPPPQQPQQTQLLSSTASMEIPQPLDGIDGGDCCTTMDTFGYNDDDALLLFENDETYTSLDEELVELEQKQSQKQCEPLMRSTDEDDDQEMSSVFLEWLKMNKESVSASELRRVRLKKSTIECGVKRLGGGKEGMKQLLKLVLHWVQTNHLHNKTHKPNNNDHNDNNIINFTPPQPPPPSQPAVVGYSGYPYPNTSVPGHYPYPYPYDGMRLGGSVSAATKEARKKRMARQRLSHSHYHHHHHPRHNQQQINDANNNDNNLGGGGRWLYWPAGRGGAEAGRVSTEQHRRVLLQGCKPQKNLRFLLQKVLKQSDVGNLGRIVLPKKEAETHLPELEARDGISIAMEDIGTSRVWNMRYRYWPNNKSRMYLLENTGDFVRANGLREGDFIVIYSDVKCGKYMIRGVKVRQEGAKSETKKAGKSQKYQNGNNINDDDDGSPFSPKTTTDQTQKNDKISKC